MKVKFFAAYRELTNTSEMQWPAEADVLALLEALSGHFGQRFRGKALSADMNEINGDTIILVNGRHIAHLQGAKTELSEADVVSIFPVVAGG